MYWKFLFSSWHYHFSCGHQSPNWPLPLLSFPLKIYSPHCNQCALSTLPVKSCLPWFTLFTAIAFKIKPKLHSMLNKNLNILTLFTFPPWSSVTTAPSSMPSFWHFAKVLLNFPNLVSFYSFADFPTSSSSSLENSNIPSSFALLSLSLLRSSLFRTPGSLYRTERQGKLTFRYMLIAFCVYPIVVQIPLYWNFFTF